MQKEWTNRELMCMLQLYDNGVSVDFIKAEFRHREKSSIVYYYKQVQKYRRTLQVNLKVNRFILQAYQMSGMNLKKASKVCNIPELFIRMRLLEMGVISC